MIPEHIKIVNVKWFSGRDSIGMVLCYDTITNQHKCYMGVAAGYNEENDVQTIAQWGSKLPRAIAEGAFGKLENYAWQI